MNLKPGYIKKCQICPNKKLEKVINMGHVSPCDTLLKNLNEIKKEKSYPLVLCRCPSCGLVQINYVVPPKILFHKSYPYKSGITKVLKNNLFNISKFAKRQIKGQIKNKLVIDIGSNDGSVLAGFKDLGFKVLGIEPTNIAKIANKKKLKTIQAFFNKKVSRYILKKYGRASIINASNVFAHVNNLQELLENVHELLADDGVFITESHYLPNIIKTLQFDSIYHEHLKYYSIKPLRKLFNNFGFVISKLEKIRNYGGSIRVYVKKSTFYDENKKIVKKFLNDEQKIGIYKKKTYKKFSIDIKKFKKNFYSFLKDIKKNNKKIIGIGSPGRAMTLLEYCNIDSQLVDCIAEQDTSLKLNMYTPGTHIKIRNETEVFKENPDYSIILSWHYSKSIIDNIRKKGLNSKIIIPLPKIRVIN